jgi:hypothetical protein
MKAGPIPMRIKISSSTQRVILIGTAVFAMLWVLARACVQTITVDEAVTYMNFVRLPFPSHWVPHANNHLLNSILMRVFTSVFGTSHLTVRSGALVGAAVYISAVYFLCKLISRDFLLRWCLFVCLVYNPLVFDFLVAARGYGLAMAFLACAIGVVASSKSEDAKWPGSLVIACGLSSACAALSFVGNFSFALVNAAAVLMLYLWACGPTRVQELSRRTGMKGRVQLLAAFVLPGALVTAALAGWLLLKWPGGELTYGSTSMTETLRSVYEASMYELNPFIVNPLFYRTFQRWSAWILPLLGAICVWRLLLVALNRSLLRDPRARWLTGLGAVLAATLALTLSLHWLAFRFFGILLPKDRTAIYLVVLCTLFIGVVAALRIPSRAGELSGRGMTVALSVLACYFMLCLRVSYFKEWKFDSDIDKVYSALAYYNHTCGITDVVTNWRYDSGLNFYAALSGRETFSDFYSGPQDGYALGKSAYVLYYPEDQRFIEEHGLKVVYRAPSEATVVIDPARMPPGKAACVSAAPGAGIR